MALITPKEAQAWGEKTKLDFSTLDIDLLETLETEVLARVGLAYTTTTWVDPTTTPRLIRVIIAKMYVSWFYDRQYSENQDNGNDYAKLIRDNAEMLISGLVDGTIELPGVIATTTQTPTFYPNDASSALEATTDDPSLGPAKFSMGMRF